jgi:hypothetical protein
MEETSSVRRRRYGAFAGHEGSQHEGGAYTGLKKLMDDPKQDLEEALNYGDRVHAWSAATMTTPLPGPGRSARLSGGQTVKAIIADMVS